jgi:hypothetical protein
LLCAAITWFTRKGAVSLLDGKLKLETTNAFVPEKKATASKQSNC